MNETKKKQIAEHSWLLYYNQVLYENGIITEQTRNKMISKINNRKN